MGNTRDSAAEAGTDPAKQPTHRIDVATIRYGKRGPVYRVMYAGEVLRARARCLLFEACRALLAKGITGRLELWRPGEATFDAACDIEVGAQWTILETVTESLRLVRWTPNPWNAVSRRGVEARTAKRGAKHRFHSRQCVLALRQRRAGCTHAA